MAEYFYSLHINDLKKKVIRQSNALFLYVFRVRWLHTDRVVKKKEIISSLVLTAATISPDTFNMLVYTNTIYLLYSSKHTQNVVKTL